MPFIIEQKVSEENQNQDSTNISSQSISPLFRLINNFINDSNQPFELHAITNLNNDLFNSSDISSNSVSDISENQWKCCFCSTKNNLNDPICVNCRYLPKNDNEPPIWICSRCEISNTLSKCLLCGTYNTYNRNYNHQYRQPYLFGSLHNIMPILPTNNFSRMMNLINQTSSHINFSELLPVKTFIEPIKDKIWDNFFVLKYKKSMGIEEISCPICLSDYNFNDSIIILQCCRRSVHYDCLRTWFNENHTCPFCKYKYEYTKIEKKIKKDDN